jgi:phage tail-like protein
MATGTRKDPFPAYCFQVNFTGGPGDSVAFFKSVSGIRYETEVTPYQEGGCLDYVHQLVGTVKWSNLVFKRGLMPGFEIINWVNTWTETTNSKPMSVNGTIVQRNTQMGAVCSWTFRDAWPCKWELSEFDAGKNELSIETLELAHHGLSFKPGQPPIK